MLRHTPYACYGTPFLLGDVTAQFIAPPATCPGDNLTFTCTVGDMNGVTFWRVNGRSECVLVHTTPSDPHTCRSGSPFIASTGTGFGTSATLFTSTLKATAIPTLNGTLVECFGPALSRHTANLVGNSILQILGELCHSREQSHSYEITLFSSFFNPLLLLVPTTKCNVQMVTASNL